MQASRRAVCQGCVGLVGAAVLEACAASVQPVSEQPAAAPIAPLRTRPLASLVTAAHLRWVVLIEAEALRRSEAVSAGLAKLFPEERRQRFHQFSALDLSAVTHAVVASYGGSTLYVADGVHEPRKVERAFRQRLVRDEVRSVPRDDVVLVRGKTGQGEERALGVLEPRVVVMEHGASVHARAAVAYAMGELERVPSALQMADLARLEVLLAGRPVRAFAPGPFEGDEAQALSGLLGVTTAAAAGAQARGTALELTFLLAGSWAPEDQAAERLHLAWQELAASPLGRLMGVHEPVVAAQAAADAQVARLGVTVDAARLLDGLHAAVGAAPADIFGRRLLRWACGVG